MAYSLKALRTNFWLYFDHFYSYLMKGIYWGSVPLIILYGLCTKPYSPMVSALINIITGHEEQYPPNPYGMPPGAY
jgi:hypothetical protein